MNNRRGCQINNIEKNIMGLCQEFRHLLEGIFDKLIDFSKSIKEIR